MGHVNIFTEVVKIKKSVILKGIIYLLFSLGAIITIFIIYKNIDNVFAIRFVIGYIFIILLSVPYFLIITFLNIRKRCVEVRKRLLRFFVLFVSLSAFILILDYIFRPLEIDFLRTFSITLGSSFGMTFYDMVKKKTC